jgi:hypothetical protein
MSAPPQVVSAEPAPEWNARFRQTDGWVGADGAYSVPLANKKVLWLFSDTFVGSIKDGKRSNVTMVNNTVGIQDGDAVSFAIRKLNGKPAVIFTPPEGKGHFWQQAGIEVDGKLFVFLPRIEMTKGGGAFGFKHVEQWLAEVSNPREPPADWTVKYAKIPHADPAGEKKRSFGAAVLRDGDNLLIYGYEETAAKPFPLRKLLVARVPVAKIGDFNEWRFLSGTGWKADVSTATPLADRIGTEFSVHLVPGLKQYVLVTTENGLGDRIFGRFAPAPTGPWSEPVLFYRCPEMKENRKVFCYAAKAHPHLAGENELVITYCVNAFEFAPVINDATLYWPQFVRVKLK